jgi:hypothetical protein
MKAVLTKAIVYFDINNVRVVLKVGTEVTIDANDGTASYETDHFDITNEEYEIQIPAYSECRARIGLH